MPKLPAHGQQKLLGYNEGFSLWKANQRPALPSWRQLVCLLAFPGQLLPLPQRRLLLPVLGEKDAND